MRFRSHNGYRGWEDLKDKIVSLTGFKAAYLTEYGLRYIEAFLGCQGQTQGQEIKDNNRTSN